MPAAALLFSSPGGPEPVALAERAWQALCDYVEVRDELPAGALFCEPDGTRLTREQAAASLYELVPERGGRFFPDLFRGVFIHRALEAVDDPRIVELMVGDDLSAAGLIDDAPQPSAGQ
jgi:hypothetical protein